MNTFRPNLHDPATIHIGPENDCFLHARRNLIIGSHCGTRTRTSNNIIIGLDCDGGNEHPGPLPEQDGSGNSIHIGDNTHQVVQIGPFLLNEMIQRIEELTDQVQRLKDELNEMAVHVEFRPGGSGFQAAQTDFQTTSSQLEHKDEQ